MLYVHCLGQSWTDGLHSTGEEASEVVPAGGSYCRTCGAGLLPPGVQLPVYSLPAPAGTARALIPPRVNSSECLIPAPGFGGNMITQAKGLWETEDRSNPGHAVLNWLNMCVHGREREHPWILPCTCCVTFNY